MRDSLYEYEDRLKITLDNGRKVEVSLDHFVINYLVPRLCDKWGGQLAAKINELAEAVNVLAYPDQQPRVEPLTTDAPSPS